MSDHGYQQDVADEAHFSRLGERLAAAGVRLDLAVMNAGEGGGKPFGQWEAEDFAHTFRIHTIGSALFAQMVAPLLKDGGTLVLTSSGVGSIAQTRVDNDLDAYAVAKAGVNMLARRLALRLADRHILVIAMAPGSVLTGMNPNGTISVEESVRRMTDTLERLSLQDSGKFLRNDGAVVPW